MAATRMMTDFAVPPPLEAAEPPEVRGLKRDEVRLIVSDLRDDSIRHARFHDLPQWLLPGDLLVVNVSATMNAALSATTDAGEAWELHLSTQLPGGFWTIEVRRPDAGASLPSIEARAGTRLHLPAGGHVSILAPYPLVDSVESASRLWIAAMRVPDPIVAYLDRHGFPIRYRHVTRSFPTSMYQTVFALEPGSAEMPSAGRPFTAELVTRLVSRGVGIAPVLLHTGVSSLETHEPPYEEFYRVPPETAERVNAARRAGRRVVAVGTTVVRALETVTDETGATSAGEGWTNLVIGADRPSARSAGSSRGCTSPTPLTWHC